MIWFILSSMRWLSWMFQPLGSISAELGMNNILLNVLPAQIPGQREFEWQCQISVPNGGLLPTSDEFPLESRSAP
jgi:hypothetical protein